MLLRCSFATVLSKSIMIVGQCKIRCVSFGTRHVGVMQFVAGSNLSIY